MNQFCVQTINVEAPLRAADGILRQSDLLATAAAVEAAAHILARAEQVAAEVRQAAQRQAEDAVAQRQQQVVLQATELLHVLQQAQQLLLSQVESVVVGLAQQTFDRLVLQLTPREQVAAMLRRVMAEAPSQLTSPMLALHPDDAALVPDSPWEIKHDSCLGRGTCRLEAASGEWRAEFGLAVTALRAALVPLPSSAPSAPPVASGSPENSQDGADRQMVSDVSADHAGESGLPEPGLQQEQASPESVQSVSQALSWS